MTPEEYARYCLDQRQKRKMHSREERLLQVVLTLATRLEALDEMREIKALLRECNNDTINRG